jgi:hypothetical protein
MLTRLRQVPSPALVIASIALILAIGGGTVALAINGPRVKKIADKQINALAPGLSVKHADSADNASQLGGVPASGYTRSDCDTRTGQLKGWARVIPNQVQPGGGFSTNGVEVSYNCSGAPVEARTTSGAIEVRFDSSPVGYASVNVLYSQSEQPVINGTVTVQNVGPGDFKVFDDIGNTGGSGGQPFLIMTP